MDIATKNRIIEGLKNTLRTEGEHKSNLESALMEIIELVKSHNEELGYDCERILDKWSHS